MIVTNLSHKCTEPIHYDTSYFWVEKVQLLSFNLDLSEFYFNSNFLMFVR